MKMIKTLSIFNFISLILNAGLSYATQLKLINTKTVADVSHQHPSLFSPADFTFSIWALIYTSLTAFCIYHIAIAFTERETHPSNQSIEKISGLFILNNVLTASWLVAWVNEELLWSVVLIVLQLITLILIHARLNIFNNNSIVASKIFTQFPLSIYLGWISIATIACISSYLVAISWNGFGITEPTRTVIIIIAVVLITITVVLKRRNVFYGLVVIWALYGIIIKRIQTEGSFYTNIINFGWIGIVITAIVCTIQVIKNIALKKQHIPFPLQSQPLK